MGLELNQSAIAQLNQDLTKAFRATATEINAAAMAQIVSPTWKWPRVTRRRNGTIAGFSRDIVDLGGIKRSQGMRVISDNQIDIINTSDHAAAVNFGSRRGGTIVPGRNWIRAGVRSMNPTATFRKKFQEARS